MLENVMPGCQPGPVRVVCVDLDQPLPDIDPERPCGGRYASALVFAVRRGVPIGHVEVDLRGQVMTAADLADRLKASLGDSSVSPLPAVEPTGRTPHISVVVPTVMRRAELLQRSVMTLAGLDYPSLDVIVVDNRPDDTSDRRVLHERLSRHPRVTVVTEPVPGISAARNAGMRHARGEIVAFTDDDAEVDAHWPRALAERFVAEPDVDCVTGLVLPAELETPAQIWFEYSGVKVTQNYALMSYHNTGAWRTRAFGSWSKQRFAVTAQRVDAPQRGRVAAPPQVAEFSVPVYRAKFGMGVNMAFRLTTLRALGGFDEALGTGTVTRGGEDIAMISRLLFSGGKLVFDPAMVVRHYHRRDYQGLRQQMYGYGVGYTAALTALVWSNPVHLIGLLHLVAPALRVLLKRSADRGVREYPRDLTWAELRGLLAGPFSYGRGRLRYASR